MSDLITVNYHLLEPCDSKCTFCFATFRDARGFLKEDDSLRLIAMLAEAGTQKINFAGGEPTLHPFIGRLISAAKAHGMTTSIVTNGFRLEALLEKVGTSIDWVCLSVDSADEGVQAALGRGQGDHARRALRLAECCREANVRLKLNSVITRLNVDENMSEYVKRFRPERWKLFQVLRVEGQNDGAVEPLLISEAEFDAYVARHTHLSDDGIAVVPESNDAMTDSYAMVDPHGRFFGNSEGRHSTSDPILQVGVSNALSQVGYEVGRLIERGGVYEW